MQQLKTAALAVILLAFAAAAHAGLTPTSASSKSAGVSQATSPWQAAKRKGKKKPAKKKSKKKEEPMYAPPAGEPTPVEPTPSEAAETAPAKTEATGETKAGGDWGSPDWASTGGSGSSSSSSSSSLLDTGPTVEKKTDPVKSSRYKRADGSGGAAFILRPGYLGAGRRYTYVKPRTPNLRPYKAPFISMLGGSGEVYPLVWAGLDIVDGIGLKGGYWQALGLKSSTGNDGPEYATAFSALDAGLIGRFHLGDSTLALHVGYGALKFAITVPASDPLADQVQDLNYGFLRAGLDFRYNLDQLGILVGAAYRHVLSTGPLKEDYFPTSSAMGFDAHLGVAYEVLEFLEVYGQANFVQFMHSFSPGTNATYAADGATDMYYGGEAGVAVFF